MNDDADKTWTTKTPGETTASIILQLNSPKVISGIDIGSFNAAFVEVLVARSGSNSDFTCLLPMSSFMTPADAKGGVRTARVRMFTKKDFLKPAAEERWDRIKFICTQTFNLTTTFGLSFVKLFTPCAEAQTSPTAFGKFTLREDSPDEISSTDVFKKKNQMVEKKGKSNLLIKIQTCFCLPLSVN